MTRIVTTVYRTVVKVERPAGKIRHYHNVCDLCVKAKCQHCRTIPFFVDGTAFASRYMILKTGEIYEKFIFFADNCP